MPDTNPTTPSRTSAQATSTIFPSIGANPDIEVAAAKALVVQRSRAAGHQRQLARIKKAHQTASKEAITAAAASFDNGDFLYGVDTFLVALPEDTTTGELRTAIFNHLRLTGRHILR
jgi:hypothetical protein